MKVTFATIASFGFLSMLAASFSSALPTPEFEERQVTPLAAGAPLIIATIVGSAAAAAAQVILNTHDEDNKARGQFTRSTVDQLKAEYKDFNVVACHTEHEAKWDGERGVDWWHEHKEVDIKLGGTIGYEIYIAKSGTFTLIGDGGLQNWAWAGNMVKDDDGTLHFEAP